MAAGTSLKPKKYVCSSEGCGKTFTRSDHLARHVLNHGTGDSTCPRCSLHFKRRDLLDRHMARHRQKDEEAGGIGLGVVESRKRMWKDADGNIVSKRPTQNPGCKPLSGTQDIDIQHQTQPILIDDYGNQMGLHAEPLSPPGSMLSSGSFEHVSHQISEFSNDQDFIEPVSDPDMLDFLANSAWGTHSTPPMNMQTGVIDDMFQPDTACSFNMPFTTMNNYNWLFGLGEATQIPASTPQNINMTQGMSAPLSERSIHQPPIQPRDYGFFAPRKAISETVEHYSTAASFAKFPPFQQQQQQQQEESFQYQEFHHLAITPGSTESAVPQVPSPEAHNSTASQNYTSAIEEPSHMGPTTHLPSSRSEKSLSFDAQVHHPPSQPRRNMPTMDEVSRSHVLDILASARPRMPDGSEITREHPLLTLSCTQNYLDLFFSRFNVAYPLLHQATFDPSQTEPLLLLSVLLLGATYSDKAIHRVAVCIHDVLRAQIFQNSAFTATPELWMLQTILLVECFGKSRAGQKQHDMAHLFHGLLINLIRRSDCQTVRQPNLRDGSGDLESDWRRAIDIELRKRLAFLCFLWDTQHAVLFSQSLCMSSFELRTTLPCNQATWEATSAEEWWSHARKEPQISYLAVLKAYMNPDSVQVPQLNALSRLLVLHGLMSVQWDLKRRDQTSLGISIQGGSSQLKWQDRLAQSYDAWKADFDTYCMNMALSLNDSPSKKSDFTRFSTATNAIYHAAHITLNVEILDLQIYAGARHIIGRPVTRNDYDRSRRVVKEWVKPRGSTPAAKAAWHAAHLLRDGIMNLENWDVNNAFHYPWCLYLATLTCWAFHFASVADRGPSSAHPGTVRPIPSESHLDTGAGACRGSGSDDGTIWHDKAEMNALVSSMTSVVPEALWRVLGKYSTSGLTAVMTKHLSNVRWAVVHEGMNVLRGLVSEQSN